MKDNDMLILELTDDELDQVVGGAGYEDYGIKSNGDGTYDFYGTTITEADMNLVISYANKNKKTARDLERIPMEEIYQNMNVIPNPKGYNPTPLQMLKTPAPNPTQIKPIPI